MASNLSISGVRVTQPASSPPSHPSHVPANHDTSASGVRQNHRGAFMTEVSVDASKAESIPHAHTHRHASSASSSGPPRLRTQNRSRKPSTAPPSSSVPVSYTDTSRPLRRPNPRIPSSRKPLSALPTPKGGTARRNRRMHDTVGAPMAVDVPALTLPYHNHHHHHHQRSPSQYNRPSPSNSRSPPSSSDSRSTISSSSSSSSSRTVSSSVPSSIASSSVTPASSNPHTASHPSEHSERTRSSSSENEQSFIGKLKHEKNALDGAQRELADVEARKTELLEQIPGWRYEEAERRMQQARMEAEKDLQYSGRFLGSTEAKLTRLHSLVNKIHERYVTPDPPSPGPQRRYSRAGMIPGLGVGTHTRRRRRRGPSTRTEYYRDHEGRVYFH